MNTELSFDIVDRLLEYRDGKLFWKSRCGRQGKGKRAGSIWDEGYRRVKIMKVSYGEHRIVWLLCKKQWPKNMIDHINRCPSDNRIENLRECDKCQNMGNSRRKSSAFSSKYRGVHFRKLDGRWVAQIGTRVKGSGSFLGSFNTEIEAAKAYNKHAKERYGEFAILNRISRKAAMLAPLSGVEGVS